MKNEVPSATEFIFQNTHLSNEDMLKKFAKLHVLCALEEAFKVSDLEAWDKHKKSGVYPQTKIK